MVLLTTAMALTVPSLRGFAAASRSKDAVVQFLSLTGWARANAASESRVYRLNINPADNSYWLTVQDGPEFLALGTDFGRVFSLPAGTRIDLRQTAPASGGAGTTIDFHPDGRADVTAVRLTDAGGAVTVIACLSPAEPFRVLSAEEAPRP